VVERRADALSHSQLHQHLPQTRYRVMNRGTGASRFFRDDADWEQFVETLVTLGWITERSRMGSVANVNPLLNHWRHERRK
jgi:hypothetical protein